MSRFPRFRHGYPGPDDPLRLFVRRNRKKILLALGAGLLFLAGALIVGGYFAIRILSYLWTSAPAISPDAVQAAPGAISALLQRVLVFIQQWGWAFNG